MLFVLVSFAANAQKNITQNLSIWGGFGVSQQDRRLFDFPRWGQEWILEHNPRNQDCNWILGIKKHFFSERRLNLDLGFAYYAQTSMFPRPYEPESGYLINILVMRYTINQISVPITIRYLFGKSRRIGLQTSVINNFYFNRKIIDSNRTKGLINNSWAFNYKSFDINPGVFYKLSESLFLEMNYRLFYLNRIEKWFFNSSVFNGVIPEEFKRKYERYNPHSFQVLVGYRF
jgi:hypothetical protein